ncbi:MAG TPA: hypothetical protein VED46_18385 [Alphaproteobacteria bacterium]|nr:hypothetical protein [Alphaproteobacteria bacterium]
MTIATLLKAALVAYGLLLGGAFIFLRFYPELASRTIFELGNRAIAVAGSLAPVQGIDQTLFANVSVELLGPAFGARLAQIAVEARRQVEDVALAAADEARQAALKTAEMELAAIEERLAKADEAVLAASERLVPAASLSPPAEPADVLALELDPAVLAAGERLAGARATEEAAREALKLRMQSFFLERRREQVQAQLQVVPRMLAEAEGGGIELAVENAGPMAVTRIVLSLSSAGQPIANLSGRAVLASEPTPLSFTPEIVNEYDEKILGLPPRITWRVVLPLDQALAGRIDSLSARILDAEFADADQLERASPYGSGMRLWAYPKSSPADLFAAELHAAAPGFLEALALTQAERASAVAEANLTQVKSAAEERARAQQDVRRGNFDADAVERQAKAKEATSRLKTAEAEKDRLSLQRAEILARIERIRAKTEAVPPTNSAEEGTLKEALRNVKSSIESAILEARAQELRSKTHSDESGGFRFVDLPAGAYYLYSPLTDVSGATLHYMQRLQVQKDGGIVFEPPLATSQEEFLYGAIEAGT